MLLFSRHVTRFGPADEQPRIFSRAASVSSSVVIAKAGEVDEIDLDDKGEGVEGGDVVISIGEGGDEGDVFVGLNYAVSVGVGSDEGGVTSGGNVVWIVGFGGDEVMERDSLGCCEGRDEEKCEGR